MFLFGRYLKKRTDISRNQERLVYWILIVAQVALSLVSMRVSNMNHFDAVYDIKKLLLRYAEDKS